MEITKRIEKAGKLLGIPLMDHIIVGDGYFSFWTEGLLEKGKEVWAILMPDDSILYLFMNKSYFLCRFWSDMK